MCPLLVMFLHVCLIGAGGVHLQSEGHVSTQSTPETVLLSSCYHLHVPCSSSRTGYLTYKHTFSYQQTQDVVLMSELSFITSSVL